MRYRLPEGCAVVIHDGVALTPDSSGCIDAPETAAAPLAAHDIHPVPSGTREAARPARAAPKRDAR